MSNKEIKPFYVDSTNLTNDQIEWLWGVCTEKGNIHKGCDDWFKYKEKYPYIGLDFERATRYHSRTDLFNYNGLSFAQVADHLGVPPYIPQEASPDSRGEERDVCLTNPTGNYGNTSQNLDWTTCYSKSDIVFRVNSILKDYLGIEEINVTDRIVEDLGSDRLDHIEITLSLEEEFCMEISGEDMESVVTVQDIYNVIQNLLSTRYVGEVEHTLKVPETNVDSLETSAKGERTTKQENLNTSLSEAFTLIKDFAKENNICIDFQMNKVMVYHFGEDYYQVTSAEDITEIINALKVLEKYKEI